jgi:hypothetical protein
MRRVIVLVIAAFCASCARAVVVERPTRIAGGKISNRAAIVPVTAESTPTPIATPSPLSTPDAASIAPTLAWAPTMLTRGGCCPGAFWSADSQEVRFLARPEPTQPASIYAVPRSGGPAKLVRREPAFFSPDGAFTMTVSGEDVVLVRSADARRWTVTTGGRGVQFSHADRYVAWTESSDAYTNLNLIQRTIWIYDLETGLSSSPVKIVGGGFLGWTQDDQAILVGGGMVTGGPRGVWQVGLDGGDPELLFEAQDIQGPLISPRGGWLAFFVAFGSQTERNGLWVMQTSGGQARRLDLFGSYRWRGEGQLLVVPLDLDQAGDALWQYSVQDESLRRLFGSGEAPFEVADNDWSVSPDGTTIAFRSSLDLNLWTLALPAE